MLIQIKNNTDSRGNIRPYHLSTSKVARGAYFDRRGILFALKCFSECTYL